MLVVCLCLSRFCNWVTLCLCICVKDESFIDPFNALASCHEHSCSLITSCSHHLEPVRHGEIILAHKRRVNYTEDFPRHVSSLLSGCGRDDAPGPAVSIRLIPNTQGEGREKCQEKRYSFYCLVKKIAPTLKRRR